MSTAGRRTLVACCGLSLVLGSIHAYSLFVAPLEERLGVSRAAASSVYSLALLCLTAAVLFGHRLFRRLDPSRVALFAGLLAALGLVVAGTVSSFAVVAVGYGVIFGGANGLGYAFALQRSAEANPERRGFAMGLVTACYALGAALSGLAVGRAVNTVGPGSSMWLMAAVVACVATGAAALLSGPSSVSVASERERKNPSREALSTIWLAYGLAVVAGLMTLGHAAPLVEHLSGSGRMAAGVVLVAGLANAAGGVLVALLVDRTGVRRWLTGLPALSALALFALMLADSADVAVAAVGMVALGYGSVIAVYPVAVVAVVGEAAYPAAYGRVFTAWGLAGVVGPIGAGAMFDAFGSYGPALVLAAVAAATSTLLVLRLSSVGFERT